MSGHSSSEICPICGNSMSTYSDYKPFDQTWGECLECGFNYWTQAKQMTLKEVNDRRKEEEPPLKPIKAKQLKKYRKAIKEI